MVNKIDSNITGLAYAEEKSLGVLGSLPVWNRLHPNSYNDFGGEVTTVAPNPINPSRQRKKGVVTDLDATGGFNHNFSFFNFQDLLQAVFFADMRSQGNEKVIEVTEGSSSNDEYKVTDTSGFLVGSLVKGFLFGESANNDLHEVLEVKTNASIDVLESKLAAETSPSHKAYIQVVGHAGKTGDLEIDISGDFPALISKTLDFTTLNLVVGQWIFVGGDTPATQFSIAENNGFKRIRSISANFISLDKSVSVMNKDDGADKNVQIFFGDVLRNETGTSIKRRSYHLERTLGARQSEYLRGAIPNEFTMNIPTANLLTTDISFLALDNLQRTKTQGPLQDNVQNPQKADSYNTSSDFSRIKMSIISDTNEAPDPLFAFITEATLTINNNLSPNKAVSVLGAFDVTAGTFQVSGNITAYFADIAAVQAVRDNADITLDMVLVKENKGIVVDVPLISLGDGRLNVEQDNPITLPLSVDAATAEDIGKDMDHTVLFTFFGYLPDSAE